MPLRFDQPSLLGEWKGDPAIIHQALSQMHSASEGEKNRANTKAIADAELKAKKPSFKIDKVDGSPFSKDQQKMGILINGAMDAINRGENPEPYTEKAQQISNTGKAQKNALDQLKLQTNELQQAYGADVIDTTPVSKEINSAYNDHDDETRGVAIGEAAKHIADPSIGMFKADTFYAKKLLDIKPVDYTYSDKNERGIVNEGTDRKVIGRLVVPDTKRPQYERKNGSLSPVLDANGQPVYEMRNASTIDDIIPMVRATFDNDKNAAQWAVNQTARTEKDEIEKITKNWIDSEVNRPDGGMPDKQTIEAKKQIVARDLTEKKIAKQWLQLDRQGTTTISNTRSLDELKQSTGGQKDAVAAAVDEAVNIETNIGGVEKRKSIYRPNAIVLPNSKPQNYNLSGDVINLDDNSRAKFTGSTNATLSTLYTRMRIGDKNFIFEAEDKDGNKLPPPTHEKIMQIIRNTPIGTKIKSDVHGIMDIVTKDNTKGVMSQEQIARLEELKKWEKLHPESPRIKDNTENAKKRSELYKLRSETQNPNQTVSAEAVNSGNLFRAFGVKTLEEGTRSKKLPLEVRQRFANILEQQKAIEEHNNRTQPKTQSNKGVAAPTNPDIKLSLIDQIKKEMPNATPEQWVSEYKKRSK